MFASTPAFLKAISLAARAHQGQTRKDNKTPYMSHVFRVQTIIQCCFQIHDEDILTAAVLHDTIEDTTIDFDDLAEEFGDMIAEWVGALSKDSRLEYDEREKKYCAVLENSCWQVQVIKLADVFDNVLDIPQLPKEKRRDAIERKMPYLSAIKKNLHPEVANALQITLDQVKQISTIIENQK